MLHLPLSRTLGFGLGLGLLRGLRGLVLGAAKRNVTLVALRASNLHELEAGLDGDGQLVQARDPRALQVYPNYSDRLPPMGRGSSPAPWATKYPTTTT